MEVKMETMKRTGFSRAYYLKKKPEDAQKKLIQVEMVGVSTGIENQVKRKRTKQPEKHNEEEKQYSNDEIFQDIPDNERVKVLRNTTLIQKEIINLKRSAYNLGQLLNANKKLIPHGMFQSWINNTFGDNLPYNTASFYMRIYDVFKDYPSTVDMVPMKYLLIVTSKRFPKELVQTLNEHPDKISKELLEEVTNNYDLFKEGTMEGDLFLKVSKEQIKLGIDIWKKRGKHLVNSSMRQSLEFGAGNLLAKINSLRRIARDMAHTFPPDIESPRHKKLISDIVKTRDGLQGLINDLTGSGGFFIYTSTPDGDQLMPKV
jgi:hypothetical protein